MLDIAIHKHGHLCGRDAGASGGWTEGIRFHVLPLPCSAGILQNPGISRLSCAVLSKYDRQAGWFKLDRLAAGRKPIYVLEVRNLNQLHSCATSGAGYMHWGQWHWPDWGNRTIPMGLFDHNN
jgi:hypothetical protein